MRNSDDDQDAFAFKVFCRRNAIGVTTGYAEVKAGRLIARKVRGKTIVTAEDGAAWRESLPKLETAAG